MTFPGSRQRRLSGNDSVIDGKRKSHATTQRKSVSDSGVGLCFLSSYPVLGMPYVLTHDDEDWMLRALELAHQAEQAGEVPVGAVLVKDGACIAEGWNCPISTNDPTAHAEIITLRAGGLVLDNYRLVDTTLYVTLEPCAMCMAAIVHARVKRLVFATQDTKRGAVCSALQLADADFLNHKVEWTRGVLEDGCSQLLRDFFRRKR